MNFDETAVRIARDFSEELNTDEYGLCICFSPDAFTDFARRLRAEWQNGDPDGEVFAATGSLNDLAVIKWISDYHPKIGDKIYVKKEA